MFHVNTIHSKLKNYLNINKKQFNKVKVIKKALKSRNYIFTVDYPDKYLVL